MVRKDFSEVSETRREMIARVRRYFTSPEGLRELEEASIRIDERSRRIREMMRPKESDWYKNIEPPTLSDGYSNPAYDRIF